MKFFRPATKDDFSDCQIQYDHFSYMSDNVKQLIEEDNFNGALMKFRAETGRSVSESKRYCEEYQKFVLAKRDFESGKPVFVSY